MAEVTFYRNTPIGAPRMVCMYCGKPATHREEKRITNPLQDPPATRSYAGWRADGDGVFGLILLALYGLLVVISLGSWIRDRKKPSGLQPDSTLVIITTCGRHRGYRRRYNLLVFLMVIVVIGGFVFAILAGKFWYAFLIPVPLIILLAFLFPAPIAIKFVGRDVVRISGVSESYLSPSPTA
jgi:4-amino-4-deoxy-L-arabinose transferase-like glycosyltransferase